MNKILLAIMVALALSISARAETDYQAKAAIESIQSGKDNSHQIRVLRVKESVVLPAGAIDSADLENASIVNADISASAAIARSKLSLGGVNKTNVIVSADSKTNTFIVLDGVITSWVVTE